MVASHSLVKKHGWTDRWQRKPQTAEIKGRADQRQKLVWFLQTLMGSPCRAGRASPRQFVKCAPLAPRPFSCPGSGQNLNGETPDLPLTSTAFPGLCGGAGGRGGGYTACLKTFRKFKGTWLCRMPIPPPPAETSNSLLTKKNIFSSVLLLVSHGGPAFRTC